MKSNIFYCLLIFAIIFCEAACSFEKKTDKAANSIDSTGITISDAKLLPGCYQMSIERDTALMQLDRVGIVITGTLSYKRFEKDRSNGTIQGSMKKDILKAWYTFRSEGRTTVREVYFKIIHGKLAEGYGDVELRNDSVYFKYPANLNFEEHHLYMSVGCK